MKFVKTLLTNKNLRTESMPLQLLTLFFSCVQDEIIVFRQLSKIEVKQIADIFLKQVFKRAEEKGIKIEVTERFKVCCSFRQMCS